MLRRIILAVDDSAQQRRLRALLSSLDAIVDTVKHRDRCWDRLSRENVDLIVVSHSLIPEPATRTISLLGQLPDSPSVVVVAEDIDREREAEFLAEFC